MANIIKPKRSNTAAKVPTTTELVSGELGVNMADRKVYINNGTAVVQVGAGNLSGLGDVAITTPSNGQALKYNSTTTKWENSSAGVGDVVGPASATDNALVRFDGATGKLIQNSTATLDDTGNMDTASLKADFFDLDTAAAAPASAVGREAWDDGAGAPIVGLKGGVVTYYYGQQEFARVYNGSGTAMTKGQVVYIVGAQGNRVDVRLAQANAESTSANTIGFVAEPIAAGAEGWVQTTGPLPKLNTSTLTAGQTVYLSPTTAGAYTTTKPTAPSHLVVLGFVERVNTTVGSIFLKIDNGYELDELHNVNISSPTGGQLLAYDQTAGYWKNIALTDGTGISVTETAGGAITVTNTAPDQTVVLTQGGATTITGTYPNFTISSVNTTYGAATSTVPGLIELGSDTQQTVAANAVSATASRSYALQVNAAGQGVVNVPWTDTNSGGTVTSVGGTGTVSGLTLTGTVTSSGNLTLGGTLAVTPSNFASQTAKTFLAAPNGAAGVPTFRAMVAADVPTLNQNTTGTAANVTGTVAVANGGTGATTAAGALTNLGALASTNPSYTGTLTGGTGIINIGSNQFYKDANGNIGIGGVPSGWGTAYKAIQGSTDLTLMAQDEIRTGTNCFYDGTNWKFISSGYASLVGTNKTTGAFSFAVSTASGTAGTNAAISTRFYVDGARTNLAGSLRVGSLSAPEGDIDFTVQSDVRWLGRAGRLDCVNNANTAWQTGVFRGVQLFFRTSDDATRLGIYSDGRVYLTNSGARGATGYVVTSPNESIANALRASGYIEYQTDVGAIGVNYFNSDARLKKNIAPTQTTARDAIDAIEFKQFDWNEYTDQDGVHVGLGVIAQQLQQINPKFVNVMSDSTLGVNDAELLTYALKTIQELSAELKLVKQELAQLKGVA